MRELIAIDLASVLHPIWHMASNDLNPDATSIGTLARVRAIASGQPFVVICCDAPPYDRKAIAPDYKAHRESNAPLQHQLALVIDQLRAEGFPILRVQGLEADDLLGAVAVQAMALPDVTVTLVTADKDAAPLVNDRVRIKSLKDGSILDAEAVKVKFGVPPSQLTDWLCLVGDAVDGIKGAEKIGPKTATALLSEFGSLDAMFAAFDKGATPTLTPNLRTRLQEFRPRAETVRSLIRLRVDAPIDIAPLFAERVATVAAGDVVTFDDDFVGFGHADSAPSMAGHVDDASALRGSAAVADVKAGPPSEILDDLRDVFRLDDGDVVNRETGEVVNAKPAFAESFTGQPAPAVAASMPYAEPVVVPSAAGETPSVPNGAVSGVSSQSGASHAEREASPAAHSEQGRMDRGDQIQGSDGDQRGDGRRDRDTESAPVVRHHGPAPRDTGDGGDGAGQGIGQRAGAASTALVVGPYERQLEPRSLSEAHMLAKAMHQARLFSAYGNAEAVLSTILAGREFGMAAMASLRAMHIIDGKPTLAADTIRALVLRSGSAEYFRCTERTNEKATFVTKRKGEPEMSLTFTMDDARRAWSKSDDAWNKSGWGKNPADLLIARAGAKLARLVYPDVVHGLYAREEFDQ